MSEPEVRTLRTGHKLIIVNGQDPLSYLDLSKKWWQFWKKRKHTYKAKTGTGYNYYYTVKKK